MSSRKWNHYWSGSWQFPLTCASVRSCCEHVNTETHCCRCSHPCFHWWFHPAASAGRNPARWRDASQCPSAAALKHNKAQTSGSRSTAPFLRLEPAPLNMYYSAEEFYSYMCCCCLDTSSPQTTLLQSFSVFLGWITPLLQCSTSLSCKKIESQVKSTYCSPLWHCGRTVNQQR